jgi:hypothetical protein
VEGRGCGFRNWIAGGWRCCWSWFLLLCVERLLCVGNDKGGFVGLIGGGRVLLSVAG